MYCACGCGQPTKLAPYSYKRLGWVKGQPQPYINGHNGRGVARPAETRAKIAAKALGRKMSDEARRAMSEAAQRRAKTEEGRRHLSRKWQRGLMTPEERASADVAQKRKEWGYAVKRRFNWTCQTCGLRSKGRDMHAHHVKPFATYPAGRFDIDNGIALCTTCHRTEHPHWGRPKPHVHAPAHQEDRSESRL